MPEPDCFLRYRMRCNAEFYYCYCVTSLCKFSIIWKTIKLSCAWHAMQLITSTLIKQNIPSNAIQKARCLMNASDSFDVVGVQTEVLRFALSTHTTTMTMVWAVGTIQTPCIRCDVYCWTPSPLADWPKPRRSWQSAWRSKHKMNALNRRRAKKNIATISPNIAARWQFSECIMSFAYTR